MHMPVSLDVLREVHEKSQREAVHVYRKKHMFDQAGTFLSQLEVCIILLYKENSLFYVNQSINLCFILFFSCIYNYAIDYILFLTKT